MNIRRKEHNRVAQHYSPESPQPRSAFGWLFQIVNPPPPVAQKPAIGHSPHFTSDRLSTIASSVLIFIICVPFCFLFFKFRTNQAPHKDKVASGKSFRTSEKAIPSEAPFDFENLIGDSTNSAERNRVSRPCRTLSSATPKKRNVTTRPSTPLLRTAYLQSSTPSSPSPNPSNRSLSRQSSTEKFGTTATEKFGTTPMDRPSVGSANYASLSHHKTLADSGYRLTSEAIELEERGDITGSLEMYRKGLRDLKLALKLQFQSVDEREKAETLNQKLRSNIKQIEERVKEIGINTSSQAASHSAPSSQISSASSAQRSSRPSRAVVNRSSNSNLKTANKFDVSAGPFLFSFRN
ncbi:hypothetical protein BJ742DRAFT_446940 [Cladochytrium replicatum]|nr:hypothetical protein BJ742DRAFT_446940 [Cladochytrium replicatum]